MVTNTTETANEAATELESDVALVENAYAYLTDKKYQCIRVGGPHMA